jgi:HipA-like C-terminal domain
MPWWFTPDVSRWVKTHDEWIGLRTKAWVVDPTGASFLRKEPLSWRATEPAIEAFTLELARRCGYPVAYGRCCSWRQEDTIVRGFISRKFHDETEAQTIGGQLLGANLDLEPDLAPDKRERQRRVLCTIGLTRCVLEQQQQRYGVDLITPFLRMLVFDAWIGNADRHSGNWAILVRGALHGSTCRLGPMYDTAGCLLAELTDETVARRFGSGPEDDAIARYVAGCPSGFGDGVSRPGILHQDLLDHLRSWPEWHVVASPLISFFSSNLQMVDSVLDEVPGDWLSPRRQHLVRRLLAARVKMLLEVVS